MVDVCGMMCQVVTSENLVPPTGDRLLRRRHQPEQHIAQWVATIHKGSAGQEKCT